MLLGVSTTFRKHNDNRILGTSHWHTNVSNTAWANEKYALKVVLVIQFAVLNVSIMPLYAPTLILVLQIVQLGGMDVCHHSVHVLALKTTQVTLNYY